MHEATCLLMMDNAGLFRRFLYGNEKNGVIVKKFLFTYCNLILIDILYQ